MAQAIQDFQAKCGALESNFYSIRLERILANRIRSLQGLIDAARGLEMS